MIIMIIMIYLINNLNQKYIYNNLNYIIKLV